MAENLKVNAKSKILTFKKKHNLLVDGVAVKNDDGNYEIFENIVDKDGHARFIEESITPETVSGITFTYAKWSLCGSHLMFVMAGNIANTTVVSSGTQYARITLPKWIFDKIYPTFLNNVLRENITYYGSDYSGQTVVATLLKSSNDLIISTNSFTTNADRMFRIAFDLLIDNE